MSETQNRALIKINILNDTDVFPQSHLQRLTTLQNTTNIMNTFKYKISTKTEQNFLVGDQGDSWPLKKKKKTLWNNNPFHYNIPQSAKNIQKKPFHFFCDDDF